MANLPAIDSLLADLLCVVVLIHCHFLAKLIFKECFKILSHRKSDRKKLPWKKIGVFAGLLCAILFVEETFVMCSCRVLFAPSKKEDSPSWRLKDLVALQCRSFYEVVFEYTIVVVFAAVEFARDLDDVKEMQRARR